MSKKTPQSQSAKAGAKSPVIPARPIINKRQGFDIPYPLLWLGVAAFAIYFPTFYFKFTELDDSIFIRDFASYNEDLSNLFVSFHRGLFNLNDTYYRPVFLDSMILNYSISGQNIMGYHVANVLFHIASVLLLYILFRKLNIKKLHAFILTLLFAVHPVLSQAVAWIPGRNDTLLAVFTLPFLIFSIDYSTATDELRKAGALILSGFFLLLAYFTKETAVFAPPVAFVLLVFVLRQNWLSKNNLIQYAVWIGCFIFWFIIRANALQSQTGNINTSKILPDFIHRLPLIIQYTGKIFLPFNLSVFPEQNDTVYYYGIIALALLAIIIYLNKEKNLRLVAGGLAIFLLFLIPSLFIPAELNKETFEHRLYLPFIGILLVLPQTILFQNKLREITLFAAGIAVCIILAIVNYQHQKNFADPVSFWSSAAETSPHSAYANMMLGARIDNLQESSSLFRKAYQLDPKEKYLNFYYGVMLQKQDSVQQSEKYLLAEKNTSGYYECDFYLARVAAERKDFNLAIKYLSSYLKKDQRNSMAHNNLLLLYLQTQQKDKAIAEIKTMRQLGLEVPKQASVQLGM